MAETAYDLSTVVCRYFAGPGCRNGIHCPLPHDVGISRKPDNVCRYFLEGRCSFYDACRFEHVHLPLSQQRGRKSREDSPADVALAADPSVKDVKGVAAVLKPAQDKSHAEAAKCEVGGEIPVSRRICDFFENLGECLFGAGCARVHGVKCDICGKNSLDPDDAGQRKQHVDLCEKRMELDMEHSFAVQRSLDKTCGICMDVVFEKEQVCEQRFGILENCGHVFCLSCIRTWRRTRQQAGQGSGINRACPECRTMSDFVIPSGVWVEDENEKSGLIAAYKEGMAKKPCKFFKQGSGTCSFGGSCFYLHAGPDGTVIRLPEPRRLVEHRGQSRVVETAPILLDFFELRDEAGLSIWADFYNSEDEGW